MQLILGLILFVLGALWVRACIRHYTGNPVAAIWDDLWDYAWGRVLGIVAGGFLLIVGLATILDFFHMGDRLKAAGWNPVTIEVERRPAPETGVRAN